MSFTVKIFAMCSSCHADETIENRLSKAKVEKPGKEPYWEYRCGVCCQKPDVLEVKLVTDLHSQGQAVQEPAKP